MMTRIENTGGRQCNDTQKQYQYTNQMLSISKISAAFFVFACTNKIAIATLVHDENIYIQQQKQHEDQKQQQQYEKGRLRLKYNRKLGESIRVEPTITKNDLRGNKQIEFLPGLSSLLMQKDVVDKDDRSNTIGRESILVPKEFLKFDSNLLVETQKYQSFPRWSTCETEVCTPIIDSIYNFILLQNVFYERYLNKQYDSVKDWWDLPMNRTSDHPIFTTVLGWWPETVYVLSYDGLHSSNTALNITNKWYNGVNMYVGKKRKTDKIMIRAHARLIAIKDGNNDETVRWPRLYKTIVQNKQSVPFLVHYSDYNGCNYHNWNNGKESIPLFTVAGTVDCMSAFPFPNSYDHTRPNVNEWEKNLKEQIEFYGTFSQKFSMVVWRGSFTGYFNKTARPPRYHLLKYVHGLKNETERDLFDINCNYFSASAKQHLTQDEVDNELGGILDYWIPEEHFQFYKAVLDIDGHSWSSRFGNLLCTSSIVLKVQPQYVDYFYYPRNSSLRLLPWKHYIPIRSDFSDLVEKAKYVMDPSNEKHVQQIIYNANQWCIQRMLPEMVADDALDIWEKYLEVLASSSSSSSININAKQNDVVDKSDWTKTWNTISSKVFQSTNPQQMTKI